MQFEENLTYHIYNQGNNHRKIFFERANYLFFEQKMRQYIMPYGDFVCYALMPNHFHWLFRVKKLSCKIGELTPTSKNPEKMQSLNDSIGILLRSYTRAINKKNNWSGSLFRKETKAKPNLVQELITVDSKNWNKPDYLRYCFYYIHQNPVKARLVKNPEDWEFSSAIDYKKQRENGICNLKLGQMFE